MNDKIIEKMTTVYVCVKCGHKEEPGDYVSKIPQKCPKCKGIMKKVVVLR